MTGRTILNGAGCKRWRSGHPWIFRDQVERISGSAGDLVGVADRDGRELGTAILSTQSKITLRRFSRGPLGRPFAAEVKDRLARACERRLPLEEEGTGLRLVYSEGDGLPGLIVDRYADVVVLQSVNRAMEEHTPSLVEYLVDRYSPRMVLARNDVGVRRLEGLEQRVDVLHGERVEALHIDERGLRHTVEPFRGQKTGLFLDQRPARALVRELAPGRQVLDLFCYQGGFALNALKGGAASVTALDASERALEVLAADAELNGLPPAECLAANAFDLAAAMAREGRTFDLIVLDPPAFAKSRREVEGAKRGYGELNRRCMQMLAPGGSLLTCSCSYNMTRPLFLEVLRKASADAGRDLRLVGEVAAGADHPLALDLPEADYLKVYHLQAR